MLSIIKREVPSKVGHREIKPYTNIFILEVANLLSCVIDFGVDS